MGLVRPTVGVVSSVEEDGEVSAPVGADVGVVSGRGSSDGGVGCGEISDIDGESYER